MCVCVPYGVCVRACVYVRARVCVAQDRRKTGPSARLCQRARDHKEPALSRPDVTPPRTMTQKVLRAGDQVAAGRISQTAAA